MVHKLRGALLPDRYFQIILLPVGGAGCVSGLRSRERLRLASQETDVTARKLHVAIACERAYPKANCSQPRAYLGAI